MLTNMDSAQTRVQFWKTRERPLLTLFKLTRYCFSRSLLTPNSAESFIIIPACASVSSAGKVPSHIISNGSTVRNGSVDSTCFQKSISTGQCPVKLRGLKMKEIVTPSQRVSFIMPKRPRLDQKLFVGLHRHTCSICSLQIRIWCLDFVKQVSLDRHSVGG